MTLLPGALRLDAEAPDALARTLLAIHAVDPPRRPRDFYDWAYPERRHVPEWASDAGVWEWAFAAIDRAAAAVRRLLPAPRLPPGNVLFAGSEVTGVVDWVETSWGPPTSTSRIAGPRWRCRTASPRRRPLPRRLRPRGRALGGDPYWDVIDAVGFLPDPRRSPRRGAWRDGRT